MTNIIEESGHAWYALDDDGNAVRYAKPANFPHWSESLTPVERIEFERLRAGLVYYYADEKGWPVPPQSKDGEPSSQGGE